MRRDMICKGEGQREGRERTNRKEQGRNGGSLARLPSVRGRMNAKRGVATDPHSNVGGVCLLCDIGIMAVKAVCSCSIGQWRKGNLHVICHGLPPSYLTFSFPFGYVPDRFLHRLHNLPMERSRVFQRLP